MVLADQRQFPVGQGGLHLTTLYADAPAMPQFSMVFDCGSHGGKDIFDQQLRRVRQHLRVEKDERILDLLVLSHLHEDHINGFTKLLAGPAVRVKTLLIPHYDEMAVYVALARAAALGRSAADLQLLQQVLSNPTQWFGERRVDRIIEIRPNSDDGELPEGFGRRPPEPDLPGRFKLKINAETKDIQRSDENTHGSVRTLIDAGATLDVCISNASKNPPFWRFIPYARQNVPGGGHGDRSRLKLEIESALHPVKQADGSLHFDASSAPTIVKALKSAYKSYIPAKKWNPVSLTLASGVFANGNLVSIAFIDSASKKPFRRKLKDRRIFGDWYWMHTGDAELVGSDGLAWIQMFRSILPDVRVFQAPHHASSKNLGPDAIKSLKSHQTLAFCTCKSGDKKHPSPVIISELNAHGIELWPVTEDGATELATTLYIRA